MKKIISLFQRNYEGDNLVRDEITPGAEWVVAGEGTATKKYDGTCCMVRDGKLFKRYEVKNGGKAPASFISANEVDEVTGKQQGWVPVGDGPEDKYHRQATSTSESVGYQTFGNHKDGTYELCGPKIQGNPEGLSIHELIPHNTKLLRLLEQPPRNFAGIREYLRTQNIEGIVWHHPDGRMVKIKTKDFGLKRGDK